MHICTPKISSVLKLYCCQMALAYISIYIYIYSIKYSTLSCPKPHARGGRNCDLCLMEKTLIASNNSKESLNKKTEVLAKCRHKAPHLLDNYHHIQLPVIAEAKADDDLQDNHPYPLLITDNHLETIELQNNDELLAIQTTTPFSTAPTA